MRVLVVGEGGREHALIWALSRSGAVKTLYAAPGNPGMARHATCVPIHAEDAAGLGAFVRQERIDLTVVGPDGALAAGVVDAVEAAGGKAFGPTRAAARIETSKAFAKQLMREEGIPTAASASFTDIEEARAYVRRQGAPIVVKADGLAAGKGVVVCQTVEEALRALEDRMVGRVFGDAGQCVVIEEFLEGEEASIFALSDGETVLPLLPSQDHKQIYDGDKGPNTGGMGAYAPAPIVDGKSLAEITRGVIVPVIQAMKARGLPYRGVLYTGMIMTKDGPVVLEFNSRFGDPETQVLLPLLRSDFAGLAMAVCTGALDSVSLDWHPRSATCVVLASEGYPGAYAKGKPIAGLETLEGMEDVLLFHANTAVQEGRLITNGGRVLGVTALADDLPSSIRKAYEAVGCIAFEGCHYRRDIGQKALKRL